MAESLKWSGAALIGVLTMLFQPNAQAQYPDPALLVQNPADFRLTQLLAEQGGELASNWQPGGLISRPANERTQGLLPDAVLQLADDIQYVVLADLSAHRVYLLENGEQPRIVREMYGTIGKNGIGKQREDDGRTPLGVYLITRELQDQALPELYGSGAFPVDYPNAWDRQLKRTGYGIWLHGVPRSHYSRAPRSSEGCVAVANQDLDSLKPFIQPGNTRAIFARQLNWHVADELQAQREAFQKRLEAWLAAWNRIDTPAYLDFYAADFAADGMTRDDFAEHKTRVNAAKTRIDVSLEQLSIYNYPDGENLRMVEYTQHYRSNNYSASDRKQQFWQQADDGQWYILREITL